MKVLWDFRARRAYAAPFAAGASSNAKKRDVSVERANEELLMFFFQLDLTTFAAGVEPALV